MEKLMITAAMVGAEVTRRDHPGIPITPEEIAEAAYECYKAGASIIHLHVRKSDGTPTQDITVFKETMTLIKEKCDAIIQISTGGAVGMAFEERVGPVRLGPEMATLTAGSVNFGEDVFINSPQDIELFALTMKEYGVKPEIEVFDTGMISTAIKLAKKDIFVSPLHFDMVMGVPGGIEGTPKNLLQLVELLPGNATWTVAGIGKGELPLGVMAIILGGHVRVGFEDNIYYSKGILADSNAQLVERIARMSRELGREVATPEEARKILKINKETLYDR
ncbi:3-keto-5-aminohexanoate cleavage protein [Pelosinus sp. sgz500959]|uniref:3-keto-5-aminohexanoate cleavage enzyme n=1 Tax=Pelosinus sp. sgz500959 TaxID=3242472 RepID=UPI00366D3DA1